MIDSWSAVTISLTPFEFAQALSTATGFIVRSRARRLYFITNYHVVSGKHPNTNEPLSSSGGIPDRLLACVLIGTGELGYYWKPLVLRLSLEGDVTWVEHPQYGRRFDVVAIPLLMCPEEYSIFVSIHPQPAVAISPSSNVAIIGFPHGISGSGAFPIWKSGAVASEPELMIDGNDYLWVDSNTRTGMSGAPVIARRFGAYGSESGSYNVIGGTIDRLIGVYAGRALDARDVTLGRVWRFRGLCEILDHADKCVDLERMARYKTVLGHFQDPLMPTISNDEFSAKGQDLSTANLIKAVVEADHRFGTGIDRVRTAAKIIASCDSAIKNKTAIDISLEQAVIVLDAINKPLGWNMAGWYEILPHVEKMVSDLQKLVSSNQSS